MKLTDQDIEAIAQRIAGDLHGAPASAPAAPSAQAPAFAEGTLGVFGTVDEAVAAAKAAFPVFSGLPLEKRGKIIENIRAVMRENATALAKAAYDETGFGRFEDKILKNQLVIEKTPGIEDLPPVAWTGDHGSDPDGTRPLRRPGRHHPHDESHLDHYLQRHRHVGRRQCRGLQRASRPPSNAPSRPSRSSTRPSSPPAVRPMPSSAWRNRPSNPPASS